MSTMTTICTVVVIVIVVMIIMHIYTHTRTHTHTHTRTHTHTPTLSQLCTHDAQSPMTTSPYACNDIIEPEYIYPTSSYVYKCNDGSSLN